MNINLPAIHPGEILADELTEIGISPSALAQAIGVPVNRITQILHGQRGITADTALRLGRWFGSGAEIWIDLQKDYELKTTEISISDLLHNIHVRTDFTREAR
jgi:addiction module HigA family antidote